MEVYPALEQTSHSQEKDAFCFGHGCRNRTVMDVSRTRHQDVESGHIHTGREERRKETPTNCSFEIRRVWITDLFQLYICSMHNCTLYMHDDKEVVVDLIKHGRAETICMHGHMTSQLAVVRVQNLASYFLEREGFRYGTVFHEESSSFSSMINTTCWGVQHLFNKNSSLSLRLRLEWLAWPVCLCPFSQGDNSIYLYVLKKKSELFRC
jgi:hypothetical protein